MGSWMTDTTPGEKRMIYPLPDGGGGDRPKRPKRRRRMSGGGSRSVVYDDDDLASLILSRLPARSVVRFRCVSRRWLCLTSEPSFLRSHTLSNPNPPVAGVIVKPERQPRVLMRAHPIPGRPQHHPPDPSRLSFSAADPIYKNINYNYEVRPLDTCSGLILIKGPSFLYPYYVCNPTTNEIRRIPDPPNRAIKAIALFFDPSSPACRTPILHYKLVCINIFSRTPILQYQILIYTSLTGSWTPSGKPFSMQGGGGGGISIIEYARSATAGGAVHWPSIHPYRMLSFAVETERFWVTPFPTSPSGDCEMKLDYFGSSGDRLHLIHRYYPSSSLLLIYELKEDHSGWLLLYRTKLTELGSFLKMSHISETLLVCVLRKVQEEEEEEEDTPGGIKEEKDLLVLNAISGVGRRRLVTYDLQKNIYKKVSLLPGYVSSSNHRWTSITPCSHSLYPLHDDRVYH